MTRQKGKRFISLFCALIMLTICAASPLSSLAEPEQAIGIDFRFKTSFDPYALTQEPDYFMKGLSKALNLLDLNGHAVVANRQADIQGQLNLNGLSAVDFRFTGWEERLSLVTSLFGEKPVVITPANYIPFLLKMYYYFDIPVQFIGVFTDPYSIMHVLLPLHNKWTELFGGTGSRSYTPEETVEKAVQLSQFVDTHAFSNWITGLLQYFGLDELVTEFAYALPDWTTELAADGGLTIEASDQGESWTLGGKTVYTLKKEEGKTVWQADIPEWEGYRLTGRCTMEQKESGLQLSMEWELYEEGELYAYLTVDGQDLPDGKLMQGDGRITVSYGGDGLGLPQTYKAGLTWDQRQEGAKTILNGQVSMLNPDNEKPVLTVDGQISWGSIDESFEPRSLETIQGIDVFCMNDITIQEFFADAKWPIIRTAIPLFLELPAGFINGLMEWMDDNGILITLMDGLSSQQEEE